MYANALVDLQDACARDQAGGGAPLAAKLPVNMATGLFNVRFAAMCAVRALPVRDCAHNGCDAQARGTKPCTGGYMVAT